MSLATLPTGDPAALGFDPERLAAIGPAMQKFVDDEKVPNLVTMVVRKGQVVHLDARGVMDFESNTPVDTGTLYRLYSNTKPIAGVATLILFEAGILTPDDPVTRFVPELKNMKVHVPGGAPVDVNRDITIRDCLTNTTSLMMPMSAPMSFRQQYRDALTTLGWLAGEGGRRATPSQTERMAALAQLPLADHPGKRFVYHVGFPILGAVLEAAAGQNMGDFFREQIFEPLGMNDATFYLKEGQLDRFPTCYVPKAGEGDVKLVVQEDPTTSEKNTGPQTQFGVGGDAGGVVAPIGGYARFGQMLLNSGELDGKRILGRKTVDMMRGNHTGEMLIPMTGRGFHFGLGIAVYHGEDARPLIRSRGTYGWGGAAGTTYFADPEEELMGICFTQVMQAGMMPGNNYQETFQRMVYQSLA